MARRSTRDPFMQAAIDEAKAGLDEGGIPIGSVLVIDDRIIGRGHNRRVRLGSVVLHAEMDAIENAGRLTASAYRRGMLDSTLSPCEMGSGTVLRCKIPGSLSARTGRSGGRRLCAVTGRRPGSARRPGVRPAD